MKTNFRTPLRRRSAVAFATVLACYLGLNLPLALAGDGSWNRRANLPKHLGVAASGEVEGILYVAGGESSMGPPAQTLFAYDPKSDSWTQKKDMPTARALPAASAVDGILYVIGGDDSGSYTWTAAVEAYDPKTDTWTTKAALPMARGDMAACAVDGLIYVIGGYVNGLTPVATVECYDPKTDQWTRKTNLPETSVAAVAQAVNGTLYVFSAKHTFAYNPRTDVWTRKAWIPGNFNSHASAAGTVADVVYLFGGLVVNSGTYCAHDLSLVYDPVQDRFSVRRTMPEPCVGPAYATIGGRIYIAGGASGAPGQCLGTARVYDSLWVYDPHGGGAPGSWSSKAELPMTVGGAGSCEADGILYVAGGESSYAHPVQTLFAYDPGTDSWTAKADMPTARMAPAAGAVDGVVYVMGGAPADLTSGVYTRAVEAYDPKTDTWTAKADMPTARAAMAACTLEGLVYVIGGYGNGGAELATVESYDPKTDHWTQKASLPATAPAPAAQVLNGIIYVFTERSTFAYDPKTDGWTREALITAPGFYCHGSAAGTVDGVVYLLGGLTMTGSYCGHALSLAYDPAQDRFAARRMMPEPCLIPAYATIGGKIYVAGGASGSPVCPGIIYYKSLWVYDPQGGVAPYLLSVTREANDTVRLVWQGEAGRLYGVKTTLNPVKGPWQVFHLSTGTTILATDAVVEATGTFAAEDAAQYFRAFEAD